MITKKHNRTYYDHWIADSSDKYHAYPDPVDAITIVRNLRKFGLINKTFLEDVNKEYIYHFVDSMQSEKYGKIQITDFQLKKMIKLFCDYPDTEIPEVKRSSIK